MPIDYSAAAKKQLNATSANDPILLLLEIDHPDLASILRVTNNNEDVTHLTNVFTALPFEITPPDDLSQGQPRAQLVVDNVGRVMTQWIEDSGGGDGATVRLIQILHSDPDTIEWEVTMNLYNVSMDMLRVTGTLAFEDFLNMPGVTVTYRPETAPGLF